MSVTINFTSPASPPNNIAQFRVERSVRSASGTITAVNNVTKIATVTFAVIPADGTLAGDQVMVGSLLYTVLTNTNSTITFVATTNLSTISISSTFVTLNDLAEFGSFETIGTVVPTLPFQAYEVHQFVDSTGSIFDFYRIKSIDTAGGVSINPLTSPFRPGQVVTLSVDDRRLTPKDQLKGIVGGSIVFEVEVIMGGRRQDPVGNVVYGDIFIPASLSQGGHFTLLETVTFTRIGLARYKATWTVPASFQGNALIPNDNYVISYKANFFGLINAAPNNYTEFDSEYFGIDRLDGPIMGRFPAYATVDDLRMNFFQIDAYLPEGINRTDVEARNKVLQYHLERASEKLNGELNLHQIRGNSSERREYVAIRAVYTIMLASRGQSGSAVSEGMLEHWRNRANKIMEQFKREGVAQSLPMGRG